MSSARNNGRGRGNQHDMPRYDARGRHQSEGVPRRSPPRGNLQQQRGRNQQNLDGGDQGLPDREVSMKLELEGYGRPPQPLFQFRQDGQGRGGGRPFRGGWSRGGRDERPLQRGRNDNDGRFNEQPQRGRGGGGGRGVQNNREYNEREPYDEGRGWSPRNERNGAQRPSSARGDLHARDSYRGGEDNRGGYRGGEDNRGGHRGSQDNRGGYRSGQGNRGGFRGQDVRGYRNSPELWNGAGNGGRRQYDKGEEVDYGVDEGYSRQDGEVEYDRDGPRDHRGAGQRPRYAREQEEYGRFDDDYGRFDDYDGDREEYVDRVRGWDERRGGNMMSTENEEWRRRENEVDYDRPPSSGTRGMNQEEGSSFHREEGSYNEDPFFNRDLPEHSQQWQRNNRRDLYPRSPPPLLAAATFNRPAREVGERRETAPRRDVFDEGEGRSNDRAPLPTSTYKRELRNPAPRRDVIDEGGGRANERPTPRSTSPSYKQELWNPDRYSRQDVRNFEPAEGVHRMRIDDKPPDLNATWDDVLSARSFDGRDNNRADTAMSTSATRMLREERRNEEGELRFAPLKYVTQHDDVEELCKREREVVKFADFASDAKVVITGPFAEEVPKLGSMKECYILNPDLMKMCFIMCHYEKFRPIQEYAIPAILRGHDLIGLAETGSGKSAAFLLPIVDFLFRNPSKGRAGMPVALVLVPTRELCMQLYDHARKFAHCNPAITIAKAHGEYDLDTNLRDIIAGGCDILIATIGRLRDLIGVKVVRLQELRFLVVDEADRMLDDNTQDFSFLADKSIGMPTKENRQTLFFSTSLSPQAKIAAERWLRESYLTVSPEKRYLSANAKIVQRFVKADGIADKYDILGDILAKELAEQGSVRRTLVFVNARKHTRPIIQNLYRHGITADDINASRSQDNRDKALRSLRDGTTSVIVATDICERGIDIPGLAHVINFDIPHDPETYIHRIGRTGRVQRGEATSIIDITDPHCIRALPGIIKVAYNEEQSNIPRWMEELATQLPPPPLRSLNNQHQQQRDTNNHDNRRFNLQQQHAPQQQQQNQQQQQPNTGGGLKEGRIEPPPGFPPLLALRLRTAPGPGFGTKGFEASEGDEWALSSDEDY